MMQEGKVLLDGVRWLTKKVTNIQKPNTILECVIYSSQQPYEVGELLWLTEVAQSQMFSKPWSQDLNAGLGYLAFHLVTLFSNSAGWMLLQNSTSSNAAVAIFLLKQLGVTSLHLCQQERCEFKFIEFYLFINRVLSFPFLRWQTETYQGHTVKTQNLCLSDVRFKAFSANLS